MNDTRAFEMTIEIAVPCDAVWQAITSAEELVRWFPTEANVTPGQGGTWVISWDGKWPWNTAIEIWEPNRHLRLVDTNSRPYDARGEAVNTSVAPLPIAIDWYLDARGGSTSLRLVHSGFGRGGAWDDEFEGVSTGWLLELNGLKHYLERHRGTDRTMTWSRTLLPASAAAVWPRIAGAGGIVRDGLRPGERYVTTLSTGDRIAGTVIAAVTNHAIQVTVDGWNDALFRVWCDTVAGETAVNAWLSAYGIDQRIVSDFGARIAAEIERIAAVPAA
jgi:uncharacterized protein YndB with AHSA1/START domain